MSQIPSLISDLAVILISAGLVTLLFKWLKQPVVLGYIVAGILAGPSITQIPTVTNIESIRIWADIGVIFLLFALGLDFSFKKLMKVGGTAVIGAITIVIGMMTLGYTTGLSLYDLQNYDANNVWRHVSECLLFRRFHEKTE